MAIPPVQMGRMRNVATQVRIALEYITGESEYYGFSIQSMFEYKVIFIQIGKPLHALVKLENYIYTR